MNNTSLKLKISKMTKDDIPVLVRLESECFSSPWSENALYSELENEKALFLTANQRGETIGYIGAHLIMDECYVTNIAVFEKYRRQGVAEALINHLCRLLREKSATFLTLEVRRSNKAAVALYEKVGFVMSGVIRNRYKEPPEDALVYTLTFGENQ